MELHSRVALWTAKKEKIASLVSRGLDLKQIEEELELEGSRITAQVREHIIWTMNWPEVKELLDQGLDVESIEEGMRLKGWAWTDNLKKKALWEFHRDEIIALYLRLRSVEAVREHMVKKGFKLQYVLNFPWVRRILNNYRTRIYYDKLRSWGISTSINRSAPPELDADSLGGPFDSKSSVTYGTSAVSSHQVSQPDAATTSNSTHSPFADMAGNTFLSQQNPSYPTNTAVQDKDHYVNMYGSGECQIEIDNHGNLQVLPDSSHMHMQAENSINSPGFSHETQVDSKSSDRNQNNSKPNSYAMFAQVDHSFSDLDLNPSDDDNISHDSGYPTILHDIAPFCSSNDLAYSSHQDSLIASNPMIQSRVAHRASTDSGYGSKTNSMQLISADYLQQSLPMDNFRNSSVQASTMHWSFESSPLHAIWCLENHHGIGFNFACCGSSRLLEFAKSATNVPPQKVYEFLCKCMQVGADRLNDPAGNTFLHNLAVTGAPWPYFEVAFAAGVDPCHRNAHGQTFAHVLNVSKFHENLVQCVCCLRALGIDFNLRDASGRTILHCIFAQPISPQTALGILDMVDCPGRQLRLRDVSGRTPYAILKDTYQREASRNPRWNISEPETRIFEVFRTMMDKSVPRPLDNTYDLLKVTADPHDLQTKLHSQYKAVIENAENGIAIEAADGSNAFHAQAALMLHDAATDLSSIERFIALGIDANDYDMAGRTPLEATIIQPRNYETELTTSEKVSLLIDKGKANVHSRNQLGHTPLYSAAIRGLDRTVQALLIRKSHVNIRANDGKSLLDAVEEAWNQAVFEDQSGSRQYRETHSSRIEACKILLERYGAVSNPTPAEALGYPVIKRPSSL